MNQRALPWSRILLVGVVSSFVMGTPMILEVVAGEGFWAPMIYISAIVLRDQLSVEPHPGFDAVPVLVGMMIHIVTALVLTAGFAVVVARFVSGKGRLIGTGVVYGAAVMVFAWFVAFPIADPVMHRLSWVLFLAAHLVWGAAVGWGTWWATRGTPA